MTPNQPTRRSLLGGLLTALFGFFCVKKAAGVQPVGPALSPVSIPTYPSCALVADPPGSITTFVHDGGGRFLYSYNDGSTITTFTNDGRQP